MQQSGFVKWAVALKNRFIQAEVSRSAVIIAYYLLLSLFPLAIAAGNILPFFNIQPHNVLPYIDALLPKSIQEVLNPLIISLLTRSSGGLLSISALGLIWSASRGMKYLQEGMNKAYGVVVKGGFVVKRGISLVMILLILILMIAFILLFSVGQVIFVKLADFLPALGRLDAYLENFKWPVTLLVLFVMLMAVYRVMPDVKLKLRNVWPGALLATVGIMLLTQLFTVYLQFFAGSFSSYGTIGAFIILMLWLNFTATILLLAAVLNATLYEVKYGPAEAATSRIDDYIQARVVDRAVARAQAKWAGRRGARTAKKMNTPPEDTSPPKKEE